MANLVGRFDVIIDYDNDGKFSWKLDGLNGFLVLPKIVIGNFVWGDISSFIPNGRQEPGEEGWPDIVVTLYDRGDTLIGTTATDENGYYEFQVLEEEPNWYYLEFALPLGAYFSPKDQTDDDIDSDADPATGRTDLFPSPQFENEVVDDTWDAGMYAIPAIVDPGGGSEEKSAVAPQPVDAASGPRTLDLTGIATPTLAPRSAITEQGDERSGPDDLSKLFRGGPAVPGFGETGEANGLRVTDRPRIFIGIVADQWPIGPDDLVDGTASF